MYVSADNPSIDFFSIFIGYGNRKEKSDYQIKWTLEGAAGLAKTIQKVDENGFTYNTVTLPHTVGPEYSLSGKLLSSNTTVDLGQLKVQPGVPSVITYEDEGDIYMAGIGEKKLLSQYGMTGVISYKMAPLLSFSLQAT